MTRQVEGGFRAGGWVRIPQETAFVTISLQPRPILQVTGRDSVTP